MHKMYYYLFLRYLSIYVLILNFPPTTKNFVGTLLYVFVVLFSFCVSHYYRKKKKNVSATRSTVRKFLGIELKNISVNCSNVSGTLLIHDLICAIISRTYALMCLSMISSFCILLSWIIHSTSLLFEVFLIEPSWWAKHKGNSIQRIFKRFFNIN